MDKTVIRNLATSLVIHEKVVTTRSRSKHVKREIDHLLAQFADGVNLPAHRQLRRFFFNERAVVKVLEIITPNIKGKRSGFVQSFNLPPRRRDATNLTMLMLLPEIVAAPKKEETAPAAEKPKKVTKKSPAKSRA